ncbi:MAG: hypothetical protein AAFR61_29960 [Bacteroidota bacterium]
MKQENSHEEALNLDALLPKSKAKPGFEVPEGYFEQFPDNLQARLKAEEGRDEPDPLSELPREEVFSVPEGYFDQLPGSLNTRLAEASASDASPVLSSPPQKEVFQVPEGYFEASAERLGAIPQRESARVVQLAAPKWQKPLAWTLAAAVALICLLIAWPGPATPAYETTELAALAELDEQSLFAAIEWNEVAVEEIVALVPEEQLDELNFVEEMELTDEELGKFLEEVDTEDLMDLVDDWGIGTMN